MIEYPDRQFVEELRQRLKRWSDDAVLELYHDAEIERRLDPRDGVAQVVRDELLIRGLSL
jgi:hypothetical protein